MQWEISSDKKAPTSDDNQAKETEQTRARGILFSVRLSYSLSNVYQSKYSTIRL